MISRTFKFLGLSAVLLLTPTAAQFGVMRKTGSSFQELNELAKEKAAGGAGADMPDLAKLQEMFAGAFNDPATMEAMAAMGDDLQKAMDQIAQMDPEDLQKQMSEAFEQISQGNMVDSIIDKKEEVLKSLEQSGMVSPEELEKFKQDPVYFEEQMRGAFDQMQGLFSDPEVLKTAANTMKGIQEVMNDPAINDLTKLFEGGLDDDVKIEEARLTLLSDPALSGNPVLKTLFGEEEFQEILKDPKKWRDAVKEGQQLMGGKAEGVGAATPAGVGEL